jgi:hypothetical protein
MNILLVDKITSKTYIVKINNSENNTIKLLIIDPDAKPAAAAALSQPLSGKAVSGEASGAASGAESGEASGAAKEASGAAVSGTESGMKAASPTITISGDDETFNGEYTLKPDEKLRRTRQERYIKSKDVKFSVVMDPLDRDNENQSVIALETADNDYYINEYNSSTGQNKYLLLSGYYLPSRYHSDNYVLINRYSDLITYFLDSINKKLLLVCDKNPPTSKTFDLTVASVDGNINLRVTKQLIKVEGFATEDTIENK